MLNPLSKKFQKTLKNYLFNLWIMSRKVKFQISALNPKLLLEI